MNVKHTLLLTTAFLWLSGPLNADQSGVSSLLTTETQWPSSKRTDQQRSQNNARSTEYYLVDDASAYTGNSLNFRSRQYQLTRDGVTTNGRFFTYGELLLLWSEQAASYHLLNIDSVKPGVWKSCWGQEVESVRVCDENTELVYIFDDENAAIEFGESASTDDGIAMGPQPEPEPAPTQPQPEPAPTQPEPEPAPTQPQPEPEPTQPEPEPAPTQPEPEPEPTQPEPEPAPTQPVDVAAVTCAAPAEELQAAILKATNDSRSEARQCGTQSFTATTALTWNDSLATAARKHSSDMAGNNFFSHTGSDGLQVWDRTNAEGYQYRYIGENIAAGQRTVGVVQNGWIDSPGHCRNIMNPQITEMGTACIEDSGSDYGTYWTVVVGQPR